MPSIACTILVGCLGLARGERFTVVVDEESLPRALELQREAGRLGAESALALLRPPERGNGVPRAVAAAIEASDVVVGVLDGSISHTVATRRALEHGARVASMGGSTEAMLARLLDGDLRAPGSL